MRVSRADSRRPFAP